MTRKKRLISPGIQFPHICKKVLNKLSYRVGSAKFKHERIQGMFARNRGLNQISKETTSKLKLILDHIY